LTQIDLESGLSESVNPPRPTDPLAENAKLSPNGVAFLDFLRAFAANIVLGHAGLVFNLRLNANLGVIGVSIFFILSGFLIMLSSLARIRRPGPFFAPYLIDRFARIFTAYVPALIFVAVMNMTFILGKWGQGGSATGPVAFIGNLLLLQDYPLFQMAHRLSGSAFYVRSYNTAEPFWTIPIEFWIYVIFGITFFALCTQERLPRLTFTLLALIASPVVIWNAAAGGGNGLSLVWVIGAGGSYLWAQNWHQSRYRLAIGATLFLVSTIVMIGRGFKTHWNFQNIGLVMLEASVILGLLSVIETLPLAPRVLRHIPTFFASYSYSLYLLHNTVLIVTRTELPEALGWKAFMIAIIASHLMAFLMYLAFERHYRHVSKWIKRYAMQKGHDVPIS
jgi:peptidoglycan/LPS O-acetylase OafA/YrhL